MPRLLLYGLFKYWFWSKNILYLDSQVLRRVLCNRSKFISWLQICSSSYFIYKHLTFFFFLNSLLFQFSYFFFNVTLQEQFCYTQPASTLSDMSLKVKHLHYTQHLTPTIQCNKKHVNGNKMSVKMCVYISNAPLNSLVFY